MAEVLTLIGVAVAVIGAARWYNQYTEYKSPPCAGKQRQRAAVQTDELAVYRQAFAKEASRERT